MLYMTKKLHHTFKLVLLGHFAVGKTSLISKFINPSSKDLLSTCPTIGAAFHTYQHYYHNNDYFKLNIWDTAGQERYRCITEMYFNNVDIGIIVYDMTNLDSLLEIENYWLKAFYENRYINSSSNTDILLFVVGNKSDLYYDSNMLPINPGLDFDKSKTLNRIKDKYPLIHFMEVSAKTNHNIYELRNDILNKLSNKITSDSTIPKPIANTIVPTTTPRKSWCMLI
jgi:small GTP-binding protein